MIGAVISSGQATLRELEEYYSVEDLYLFNEIAQIDGHNRRVLNSRRERG